MRRFGQLAAIAALALLTVAVYAQVRAHGYVNLDDDVYILRNPWVRSGIGNGCNGACEVS